MMPVYSSDPASENAQFFRWTPSGHIVLDTRSEEIARRFPQGEAFYVLFENWQRGTPVATPPSAAGAFLFRIRKLCNEADDGEQKLYGVTLRKEDDALEYASEIELGTINPGAAEMFLAFGYVRATFTRVPPEGA